MEFFYFCEVVTVALSCIVEFESWIFSTATQIFSTGFTAGRLLKAEDFSEIGLLSLPAILRCLEAVSGWHRGWCSEYLGRRCCCLFQLLLCSSSGGSCRNARASPGIELAVLLGPSLGCSPSSLSCCYASGNMRKRTGLDLVVGILLG